MIFKNTTALDSARILGDFHDAARGFPTNPLDIRIRYSRGADFSGTCYYATSRLHVNLGKHLRYPYHMDTYIARAVTTRSAWWKPLYAIELADAYQVVLFVLMHEYYHWLIKRAGRNTRQKESMCDRFAARAIVDRFNAQVRDASGKLVPRPDWDFQNLDRFVAPARTRKPAALKPAARSPIPKARQEQLLLFD